MVVDTLSEINERPAKPKTTGSSLRLPLRKLARIMTVRKDDVKKVLGRSVQKRAQTAKGLPEIFQLSLAS